MMPPERKPIEAAPPPEAPLQDTKETAKQPPFHKEFVAKVTAAEEKTLLKERLKPVKSLSHAVGVTCEAAAQVYLEEIDILPPHNDECAVMGRFLAKAISDERLLSFEELSSFEERPPLFRYEPDFVVVKKEERNGRPYFLVKGVVEVKVSKREHDKALIEGALTLWEKHPSLAGKQWNREELKERLTQLTGAQERTRQIEGVADTLSDTVTAIDRLSREEKDNLFMATDVAFRYPIKVDTEEFKIWYVTLENDKEPTPEGTVHVRLPLTKSELYGQLLRQVVGNAKFKELEKERQVHGPKRAEREISIIAEEMVAPTLKVCLPGLFKEEQLSDEAILSLAAGRSVDPKQYLSQRRFGYPNLRAQLIWKSAKTMRRISIKERGGWDKVWWESHTSEIDQRLGKFGVGGGMKKENFKAYKWHFSDVPPDQRITAIIFIGTIYSLRNSLKDRGIKLGNPIRENLLKKARS